MSIVSPLRHHGALLGSGPWCIQRRHDDDPQQGSQAPRSRSHDKDWRSLHRRPRANHEKIRVGFTSKSKTKSSVAVQYTKLPDRETADRLKRYWSERLDALADMLAEL